MALNYQNLTTQEPVFLGVGEADYKYNNESIELLGLYQFNVNHAVEGGLNLFTEDYEYLSGATADNVPQALVVDKYLFKFLYKYYNLNYDYQYVEGVRNTFNYQLVRTVNTGNEPDFMIAYNDVSYFERIGENGNFATRLRLGLSSNIDTPFAPFAVDNNLNIRGVGILIDRGTGLIVLNTEYRHTLIDYKWFVLQSNVFVDSGTWRKPGGDFADFSMSENIRVYPGVGLRLMHKHIFNAVFRIDYGHGITPGASRGVVFGIGQYF